MPEQEHTRQFREALAAGDVVDRMFVTGRSYKTWQDRPVDPALLRDLYELMKFGPTCHNSCPLRIKFVVSPAQKAVLHEAMADVNKGKVAAAPVSAVLGMDMNFPDTLPVLYPVLPKAVGMYRGSAPLTAETAFRNSSMQAGYLVLAARALGLDAAPMSAFDKAKVDAAFWAGTAIETNVICNLGYGKPEDLLPRDARPGFDEVCEII